VTNAPPPPLPDFDPASIVELDVRDLLAAGHEPLPQILAAVEQLPANGVLHLRSPFRPNPLLQRLAQLGFTAHASAFADDDWSTWFWREGAVTHHVTATPAPHPPAPAGTLDLRLLPPPEPLLRILEAVEASDAAFDVLLPFFPQPLVALLEPAGRRVVLLEHRSDGVLVRIEMKS
jgi:hypothetical protein